MFHNLRRNDGGQSHQTRSNKPDPAMEARSSTGSSSNGDMDFNGALKSENCGKMTKEYTIKGFPNHPPLWSDQLLRLQQTYSDELLDLLWDTEEYSTIANRAHQNNIQELVEAKKHKLSITMNQSTQQENDDSQSYQTQSNDMDSQTHTRSLTDSSSNGDMDFNEVLKEEVCEDVEERGSAQQMKKKLHYMFDSKLGGFRYLKPEILETIKEEEPEVQDVIIQQIINPWQEKKVIQCNESCDLYNDHPCGHWDHQKTVPLFVSKVLEGLSENDVRRRALYSALRHFEKKTNPTGAWRGGQRKADVHFSKMVRIYLKVLRSFPARKVVQGIFPTSMDVNHSFTLEGVDDFVEMFSEKFAIFSKKVDWKRVLTALFLCLTNIWHNFDRPTTVILSLSQFLLTLGLADDVMDKIYTVLTSLWDKLVLAIFNLKETVMNSDIVTGKRTWKVQAGEDEELKYNFNFSSILPYLGGFLTVIVSVLTMQKLPGGDNFDKTFQRFSRLSGVVKSASDIAKLGNSVLSTVIDEISLRCFGVERPIMNEWKNINLWVDEVTALIKPDFEQEIKMNAPMKAQVESLIMRGMKIFRMLDALKVPMTERQSVTQCLMFLLRVRETTGNCGAGQTKPRVAPAIFHFYGDSGVGKSTTLWAFIAEIQAALGCTDAKDLHEKTYFRRPGDKFWDGFHNGVEVVVCDDFGAIRDDISNPNQEFLEAIHMSNTAHWQLNMADLSDKGMVRMNAKALIWTSNVRKHAIKSLTNAEAVLERIAAQYKQRPRPEFAMTTRQGDKDVEKLDKAKVDAAIRENGESAILDCIVFDRTDPKTPNETILKANMTFWDVAEELVEVTLRNMGYFDNFSGVLETHMANAIERTKANNGVWKRHIQMNEPRKVIQMKTEFSAWQMLGYNLVHLDTNSIEITDDTDVTPINMDYGKWQHPPTTTSDLKFHTTRLVRDDENKVVEELCFKMDAVHDRDVEAALRVMRANCLLIPDGYARVYSRAYAAALRRYEQYCVMNGMPPKDQEEIVFAKILYLSAPLPNAETICNCKGPKRLDSTLAPYFVNFKYFCDKMQKTGNSFSGYAKKQVKNLKDGISRTWETNPGVIIQLGGIATMLAIPLAYRFSGWFLKKLALWMNKPITKSKKRKTESYDTQKTLALAARKIEVSYDTDRTRAMAPKTLETYSQDLTKNLPNRMTMENYANDTTKNLPPRKVEAVVDQNAAEVVSVVHRNMYKLEYFENDEWRHAVNVTMLKGRIALMNRHVLIFKNKLRWRIRNAQFEGIEIDLFRCPAYYVPDTDPVFGYRDAMVVEFPRIVHQHKDITSKFMTGDDFSRFTALQQISVVGFVPGKNITMRQYFGSDVLCDDGFSDIERQNGDLAIRVRRIIQYNIQTTPGDCGAVLVAFDKNFNNKILGIHSGGTEAPRFTGFGTPLSVGFIRALLDGLPIMNIESLMSPDVDVDDCMKMTTEEDNGKTIWKIQAPFEGNFMHMGMDASKRVHQSTETKIIPSPIYGVVAEPTMAPAKLKTFVCDGEVINPMVKARAKASPQPPMIDQNILQQAFKGVEQMIVTESQDARILSYEEAIKGVEGDNCFPPMKRSTSPGFGWSKAGKGKTAWLGKDDYILDNPELLEAYTDLLEKCKAGQRPSTIWVDTLKDERRPIEKKTTRLFSCGEMAFTVLFRQYFGGFIAHMMRNKIDFESCVGTNVYSHDWTKIVCGATRVGNKFIAGDFTNYDGTLHPDLLWKVLELVISFYRLNGILTPEVYVILHALFSEIVNSIHVWDMFFYMWNHSQPSGCPITTILNCCYHSLSALYVYLLIARKRTLTLAAGELQIATIAFYRKHVAHYNYGDDDVWCISDEIIDWFNQITISEAYKSLGMVYTDESKSGNLVPYRRLDEINFLKRSFRWDEEQTRYRAPLALTTIREMPSWNHGTVDSYELTASILEDAVHELAQHDQATFDRELPAFERGAAVIRRRFPVNFETYEGYQFIEAQQAKTIQMNEPKLLDRGTTLFGDMCVQQILPECGRKSSTIDIIVETKRPLRPRWESYLTLLMDVCPSKTIGYSSATCRSEIECSRCMTSKTHTLADSQNSVPSQSEITTVLSDVRVVIREVKKLINDSHSICKSQLLGQMVVVEQELVKAIVISNSCPTKKIQADEPNSTSSSATGADSLMLNTTTQELRQETVAFSEDGDVATATQHTLADLANDYLLGANDSLENSVKNFLARPIVIREFEWNSAVAPTGAVTADLVLPSNWLAQSMIKAKTAGFRYFRGEAVVRVQVNAQPMNAGRLLVVFIPFLDNVSVPMTSLNRLNGLTGYRHVDLDIGETTSCEFRIPFVCPLTHIDLVSGIGSMGHVQFLVYSPLTGSPNVEGTVWVHFEKVDLEMPTGLPQFVFQAGSESKKGDVQTLFESTGNIAKKLGGIPIIGDIATSVSWFSDAAAGLAGMFGFSKPVTADFPTAVDVKYSRNMTNFNGDSKSKVLALDARNQIETPRGFFGTDEDEMAFSTILQRKIYLTHFNVLDSDNPGTEVFRWPVHPASCTKSSFGTVENYHSTYLSYFSPWFAWWRGGINYYFKMVKTPFHSVRLRVTFVPGGVMSTDMTTVDRALCYTEVVDSRDKNSFEFNVPFVSNTLWQPILNDVAPTAGVICPDVPTGIIVIEVLNSLRNPTTVENSIDILVETCAADDFQFAFLRRKNAALKPAEYATTTFAKKIQAGEGQTMDSARDFFPQREMVGFIPNTVSMGEAITSVRQILKRNVGAGLQVPAIPANTEARISAFGEACNTLDVDDLFSWFSCIYRLKSGSMRYMIVPQGQPDTPLEIFLSNYAEHNQSGTVVPFIANFGGVEGRQAAAPFVYLFDTEKYVDVEVPFYQPYPVILTGVGQPLVNSDANGYTPGQVPFNHGSELMLGPLSTPYHLNRVIGEDFSLGYLIGAPWLKVDRA